MPEDEFTSVLFPLLVARERGATVREVAFDRLVEEIGPRTTLVAVSLTQMQTGRTVDLAALVDRATAVGARILLDVTQATPFVPLAPFIDRVDYSSPPPTSTCSARAGSPSSSSARIGWPVSVRSRRTGGPPPSRTVATSGAR